MGGIDRFGIRRAIVLQISEKKSATDDSKINRLEDIRKY
jgi:hypothetical protein